VVQNNRRWLCVIRRSFWQKTNTGSPLRARAAHNSSFPERAIVLQNQHQVKAAVYVIASVSSKIHNKNYSTFWKSQNCFLILKRKATDKLYPLTNMWLNYDLLKLVVIVYMLYVKSCLTGMSVYISFIQVFHKQNLQKGPLCGLILATISFCNEPLC
jgi:hypothetical protein